MQGTWDMKNTRKYETMICVDSNTRPAGADDDDFSIVFARISNVVKIEMVSAEIINSLFNVTTSNNVLIFDLPGAALVGLTLTVPANVTYTPSQIVAVLNEQLTAFVTLMTFTLAQSPTVTYDRTSNFITFTAGADSVMTLKGLNAVNGLWGALGFTETDQMIQPLASLRGELTVQLKGGETHIYARLHGYGTMEANIGQGDIFAKVATSETTGRFDRVITQAKEYKIESPLPSLQTLRISLLRWDCSVYQTRETNFGMTLRITYMQ